jgi:hypothetical protein
MENGDRYRSGYGDCYADVDADEYGWREENNSGPGSVIFVKFAELSSCIAVVVYLTEVVADGLDLWSLLVHEPWQRLPVPCLQY